MELHIAKDVMVIEFTINVFHLVLQSNIFCIIVLKINLFINLDALIAPLTMDVNLFQTLLQVLNNVKHVPRLQK